MMDFGDTRQVDPTAATEIVAKIIGDRGQPIGHDHDSEVQMDPWWELLGDIAQDLERLEGELLELRQECQRLEKAGMYPAVPTESWERRDGGKSKYLRMVFPQGTPGVRRKEYVGCKPEAIAEARRLAANRQRWEELDRAGIKLERFLAMMRSDLHRIAGRVGNYGIR